jgi:hypothetical protein
VPLGKNTNKGSQTNNDCFAPTPVIAIPSNSSSLATDNLARRSA